MAAASQISVKCPGAECTRIHGSWYQSLAVCAVPYTTTVCGEAQPRAGVPVDPHDFTCTSSHGPEKMNNGIKPRPNLYLLRTLTPALSMVATGSSRGQPSPEYSGFQLYVFKGGRIQG